MVYYGLFWSTLVYYGLFWSTLVYYGLFWSTLVYFGLFWSILPRRFLPDLQRTEWRAGLSDQIEVRSGGRIRRDWYLLRGICIGKLDPNQGQIAAIPFLYVFPGVGTSFPPTFAAAFVFVLAHCSSSCFQTCSRTAWAQRKTVRSLLGGDGEVVPRGRLPSVEEISEFTLFCRSKHRGCTPHPPSPSLQRASPHAPPSSAPSSSPGARHAAPQTRPASACPAPPPIYPRLRLSRTRPVLSTPAHSL